MRGHKIILQKITPRLYQEYGMVMVRVKSGKRQVVGAGAEVCVLMAGLSCTLSSVPRRDRI